jgi:branched-chain amino acid transport system ATP-binding protein
MTALLTIENVSVAFGGIKAVQNVSWQIPQGSIYSIIGPNGAGKTTLFNIISGIYAPDQGSIRLRGEEIGGLRPDLLARQGLSRTFQNLQVFMRMSAADNVMVGCHLHEKTSMLAQIAGWPSVSRENRASLERARELLDFVGLKDHQARSASAMSYGALKRLEIARALATRPVIILLDEPAAGCNPTETAEIETLIRKIAASGVTVLLVEHDMKLVMRVSSRILVLDRGQPICEGDARRVQQDDRVITAYLGTHGSREAASA